MLQKKLLDVHADGVRYNNRVLVYVPNVLLRRDSFVKDRDADPDIQQLRFRHDISIALNDVVEDLLLHEAAHILYSSYNNSVNDTIEERFCVLTTVAYAKTPYVEFYNIYISAPTSALHRNILLRLDRAVGGFAKGEELRFPSSEDLRKAAQRALEEDYPSIFSKK